ncbi:hypothetical protein [Cellulomonas gilvus]|uniref:Uncharacterized protein n=1 Tax=Cellulomonas gilvus (strain ATCC 13127 / NRRL B-14078) TaxID=593907 RepID=F8A2Z4_CELGA|nr:hypothetical protein [Cellulomonas gilvus]AEI11849.1 hypothetical protein Celgi_1330 [Cellulomonas gilvus ATCC 13127]
MTHLKHVKPCERCWQPIALVLVVPEHPRKGATRKHIPLDPGFDPATSRIAPSHALSAGRTTCRPLTTEHPLAPHEHAALTHFATCPVSRTAPPVLRPRRLAAVLLHQERAAARPNGSGRRVDLVASAASRAHTEAAYWHHDDPALGRDYELAARLLEDRYARVWRTWTPRHFLGAPA